MNDLIVNGEDWLDSGTVEDAIQPRERMCSGSVSTYTVDNTDFLPRSYGRVDVTTTTGIVRMYDGVTTSETNFIGYGIGEINYDLGINGSISTSAFDGIQVQALVALGGYSSPLPFVDLNNEAESTYISIPDLLGNDFHCIFFAVVGSIAGLGATIEINSETRTAAALSGSVAQVQAEITSLDFWTY